MNQDIENHAAAIRAVFATIAARLRQQRTGEVIELNRIHAEPAEPATRAPAKPMPASQAA